MTLSGRPSAAVLIHPGQRKLEGACQTQSIPTAMVSLGSRRSCGIQRQTNHQPFHPPIQAKALQKRKIGLKFPAMQRWQWSHGDPQRVTPGQTDSATAYIQAQNGTGPRHFSGDRGWAMEAVVPGAEVVREPGQRIG